MKSFKLRRVCRLFDQHGLVRQSSTEMGLSLFSSLYSDLIFLVFSEVDLTIGLADSVLC